MAHGSFARFRGLIASASLKLARVDHGVLRQHQIPRLDCLGLIEALLLSSTSSGMFQIPRLDCLGLIEAGCS